MIPGVALRAIFERAGALIIAGAVVAGDRVGSTCDGTIPGGLSDKPGDLEATSRAITAHQRPFIALAVIFEVANPKLPAVTALFKGECTALLQAVLRGRVGDGWPGGFWLRRSG